MKTNKTKAPAGGAAGALTKHDFSLQFSQLSTTAVAQRERILQALIEGPKTSYQLRSIGCYQSAARVKELRDRFHHLITTDRVTLVDRDNYTHAGCALYTLVEQSSMEPRS